MQTLKKHFIQLEKKLHKHSTRNLVLIYLGAFIFTFIIGIALGSFSKLEKISRIFTLQKQIKRQHNQRINEIVSRFGAQTVSQKNQLVPIDKRR